ncbi:unnamed protein product, partial [Caretta caretta]
MMVNFLAEHKIISADGCLVQIFFIFLPTGADIFILSAIVYDCYTAIFQRNS